MTQQRDTTQPACYEVPPPSLLLEAANEIVRLRAELATESSRKCAGEHDCVWQPHCAHAGKCMRPERPAGA